MEIRKIKTSGENDDRWSNDEPEKGNDEIPKEIPFDRPRPGLQIVPTPDKDSDHGYPPLTPDDINRILNEKPIPPEMIN